MSNKKYNLMGVNTNDDSEDTIYQETKKTVDDEDTLTWKTSKANGQSAVVDMEPVVETYAEEVKNPSGKKTGGMSRWKKVTIGGVTGIAMGVASAYALHGGSEPKSGTDDKTGGGLDKQDKTEERNDSGKEQTTDLKNGHEEQQQPVVNGSDGFKTATPPTDGMTFGQAFRAARNEVGPGGIFEFEGEIYSTYTEEEWDAMSSEEKATYNNRLNDHIRANHHPDTGHYQTDGTADVIHTQTHTDGGQGEEVIHTTKPVEPENKFEIHQITEDAENGVSQVIGSVGETGVTFIDTPDTPYVEYMAIDGNHNGQVDEGEVFDITEAYRTMDDLTAGSPYEGYQTPDVDPIQPMDL